MEKLDPEYKGLTTISYLESPFQSKQMIEESIFTLAMTNSDCTIAVEEVNFPIYKRNENGLELVNKRGPVSSDLGRLYREMLTVSTLKNSNVKQGSMIGSRIVNFSIPADQAYFIKSSLDLKVANIIAQEKSQPT
jgi:CMP-N-acetylneuraminic acid synthetase